MTDLRDNAATRIFAGIAAVFVWLVLIVQFSLQLANGAVDTPTSERIVRFFRDFATADAKA